MPAVHIYECTAYSRPAMSCMDPVLEHTRGRRQVVHTVRHEVERVHGPISLIPMLPQVSLCAVTVKHVCAEARTAVMSTCSLLQLPVNMC